MQNKKCYRSKIVMIARRIFHETCPGNVYFTVSNPRVDGTFIIQGSVHGFLNDGLKEDYIKFDKNGNVIEIGKI